MWTENFQMYKQDLEKAEEPEIKLATSIGSQKKLENSRKKHLLLLHWLRQSLCVNHNKLWKILKEMGIPEHLICLLQNLCAGQEATDKTRHGTTDGFQIWKGICQVAYCHPAYLTSMHSTSRKMLGWMKDKLEARLLGEISITSDMQMIPPLWQKLKN